MGVILKPKAIVASAPVSFASPISFNSGNSVFLVPVKNSVTVSPTPDKKLFSSFSEDSVLSLPLSIGSVTSFKPLTSMSDFSSLNQR